MIRIMIVDDHAILREGLRALIEREEDMEVVAEAESGAAAIDLASRLTPNVILMDISMADMDGIEATRRILADRPPIKVIALSMHTERKFVSEMLKAGASGYLWKSGAYKEVNQAIRTVAEGNRYLSPAIAGVVIDDYVGRVAEVEETPKGNLTNRETEVLQLLAEGLSSREIASRIGVSSKTVDVYRKRIMDKLGIRSVAELTKYAIREGITAVE